MASTIVIGSIIFTIIWILSVIAIDKISQKRADKPYLKEAYRM